MLEVTLFVWSFSRVKYSEQIFLKVRVFQEFHGWFFG
jgi:hypothetical protein